MNQYNSPTFSLKTLFSTYQFVQVGLFAYYLAFLPIYLADVGNGPKEIAIISLITTISMMLAGPITQEISHSFINPKLLNKLYEILSIISFIVFLSVNSFYAFCFIWPFFMACRMGSQILIDSELVRHNFSGGLKFERIRVWGSIGFILVSFLLGLIFKAFNSSIATIFVFPIILLLSLVSFRLSKHLEAIQEFSISRKAIFQIFKNKNILVLLTCVALMWMAHTPLYIYLSLYLERLGFTSSEISIIWNLGVIAEICFFLIFTHLEKYFSILNILRTCLFLAIFRWVILHSFTSYSGFLVSQLFHAFTFAAVYIFYTKFIYNYFPKELKHKSQAYLAFLGIGFGSLFGRLIISAVAENLNDYLEVKNLFLFSIGVGVAAFIISFFIKEEKAI